MVKRGELMSYIIENANILKQSQFSKCSILIKENRIAGLKQSFNHEKFMKMNAETFIMTPTYCQLDAKIPIDSPNHVVKEYIIKQFLLKGSTTFLTYVKISNENELTNKLKATKTALLNSPIDFSIGVFIPLKLLTPTLIRKCKKEQLPAIFVEINEWDRLEDIPWTWIREALFPFNSPLIPVISSMLKKETKKVLSKWKYIMIKGKIPSIFDELEDNQPLSINVLNKMGLYPRVASLMHGTEISYNLYLQGNEVKNVDEEKLFHYHEDKLVVTVHKGKVVRSGKEVLFKPGNGEYVKVRTPSYFSL